MFDQEAEDWQGPGPPAISKDVDLALESRSSYHSAALRLF